MYNILIKAKEVIVINVFTALFLTISLSSLVYSDIDMAISSTVFFAEDKSDVKAMAQKSAELGLFTYSVESLAAEPAARSTLRFSVKRPGITQGVPDTTAL